MPSVLFEKGSQSLIDEFNTHGNSKLEQGVSCLTCHRITKADSKGNSAYTLDLTNRKKYVFEDSNAGVKQWLSEKFINSNPLIHKQSYSNKIYKESAYCASCHDEFLPDDSKRAVVSTFKEWEKSPFNNPKDPTKHKTCIDCHMTYLENGKVLVGVKNVGTGHHLPTGVSDFRELWLDVTVIDRDSKVVFSSGKLKEDGNLDTDARPFMKVFGDENSEPVGLLFWRYKKLLSDTRIPAGERRVETYNILDIKNLKYPLNAVVKLNFRIYPQWVTNAVQRAFPQLPNPSVVILKEIQKEFQSQK